MAARRGHPATQPCRQPPRRAEPAPGSDPPEPQPATGPAPPAGARHRPRSPGPRRSYGPWSPPRPFQREHPGNAAHPQASQRDALANPEPTPEQRRRRPLMVMIRAFDRKGVTVGRGADAGGPGRPADADHSRDDGLIGGMRALNANVGKSPRSAHRQPRDADQRLLREPARSPGLRTGGPRSRTDPKLGAHHFTSETFPVGNPDHRGLRRSRPSRQAPSLPGQSRSTVTVWAVSSVPR